MLTTATLSSYESIFSHSQEDTPRDPRKPSRNRSKPKSWVKVNLKIASVIVNTNIIYVA